MKYVYHTYIKLLLQMTSLINKLYFFLLKVDAHKSCRVRGRLFIRNSGKIKIHENVIINSAFKHNPIGGQTFTSIIVENGGSLEIKSGAGMSNSSIYCKKEIIIGENVFIGGDCKIYDTDFHSIYLNNRLKNPETGIKTFPVKINDGVFIGTGSIVLKGVEIGENSVIAAGSVVSKNIPENEIWGGNPVMFLKKIDN